MEAVAVEPAVVVPAAVLAEVCGAVAGLREGVLDLAPPGHVAGDGSWAAGDGDLDAFVERRDALAAAAGDAAARLASLAAAPPEQSCEGAPGGGALEAAVAARDVARLHALCVLFRDRAASASAELEQLRLSAAAVDERERRQRNWARDMLRRETSNAPTSTAPAVAPSAGASTEQEALAHHIIDRTFDEHKVRLRQQLDEARAALQRYENGEALRAVREELAASRRELSEAQRRAADAANRTSLLTADVLQLQGQLRQARANANANADAAPTPSSAIAGDASLETLLLQMHLSRCMTHQHVLAECQQRWYDALLAHVAASLAAPAAPTARNPTAPAPPATPSKPSAAATLTRDRLSRGETPQLTPNAATPSVAYGTGASAVVRAPLHPRVATDGRRGSLHKPARATVARLRHD